jgi:hypothetical protein
MITSKIIILGAGGHGILSLKHLFEEKNLDFKIYYNTTDWGGSYGLWGRLLEYNNQELNQKLHNQKLPILPFADPNKLICYYSDKFGIDPKQYLDLRSNSHKDHINAINKIFDQIKMTNDQKFKFLEYFGIVWYYYKQNKFNLEYQNKLCLGYVLQSFLHSSLGGMKAWNNFYHNLGILPKNVEICFSSNNRSILAGKDISLESVIGEDKLDDYHSPILPDSVELLNLEYQNINCNQATIDCVQQSDLVIIPNGSVANWLPLTNDTGLKPILRTKKIVWITNPYRTHNELINPNYYLYLQENGFESIPLAQKNGIKNNGFWNVLDQDKQGKYKSKDISSQILKIIKEL